MSEPRCKCGHPWGEHYCGSGGCELCKCPKYRANPMTTNANEPLEEAIGETLLTLGEQTKCLECGKKCNSCCCDECLKKLEEKTMSQPAIPEPGKERCEWCGWPLATSVKEGCVEGNCSQRPLPETNEASRACIREQNRKIRYQNQLESRCKQLEAEVERLKREECPKDLICCCGSLLDGGHDHTTCGPPIPECQHLINSKQLRTENAALREAIDKLIEAHNLIDSTYGVYMPDGLLRKNYLKAKQAARAASGEGK